MDINSGFVRSSVGPVQNMYDTKDRKPVDITKREYQLYRTVINRIKEAAMEEFGLQLLHFTAPTFVTREASGQ